MGALSSTATVGFTVRLDYNEQRRAQETLLGLHDIKCTQLRSRLKAGDVLPEQKAHHPLASKAMNCPRTVAWAQNQPR